MVPQDVVVSSDGQFALSGSWDGTLRLWDLNNGSTTRRFVGHTKDVLSVAFSHDNRSPVAFVRILANLPSHSAEWNPKLCWTAILTKTSICTVPQPNPVRIARQEHQAVEHSR